MTFRSKNDQLFETRCDLEEHYEYFAITTDKRPHLEDPRLVCRRWTDGSGQAHDEAFTNNLVWEPSTALIEAEVRPGAVHRVDAVAAARFEEIQRERMAYLAPPDGQYFYLVWVDRGSMDSPDAVIRTWPSPTGSPLDEWYVAGSGWLHTGIREQVTRGIKDGTLEPVDHLTAERLVQLEDQRHAERG